jgi:hypothetical protein
MDDAIAGREKTTKMTIVQWAASPVLIDKAFRGVQ